MEIKRYIQDFLSAAGKLSAMIDQDDVEKIVKILLALKRKGGRLFILGVGGGAANASHAVNDFRKIAGIEAYTPADNVAELTARANDAGWESIFADWLQVSNLGKKDCVFVFSVGGGDAGKNISTNLIFALRYAKKAAAKIIGVVGRDGGYTAKVADAVVIVPVLNKEMVTPFTESFQAIIWHLVVTHPALKASEMKWESVK